MRSNIVFLYLICSLPPNIARYFVIIVLLCTMPCTAARLRLRGVFWASAGVIRSFPTLFCTRHTPQNSKSRPGAQSAGAAHSLIFFVSGSYSCGLFLALLAGFEAVTARATGSALGAVPVAAASAGPFEVAHGDIGPHHHSENYQYVNPQIKSPTVQSGIRRRSLSRPRPAGRPR